jgi:hypothetical protein
MLQFTAFQEEEKQRLLPNITVFAFDPMDRFQTTIVETFVTIPRAAAILGRLTTASHPNPFRPLCSALLGSLFFFDLNSST